MVSEPLRHNLTYEDFLGEDVLATLVVPDFSCLSRLFE
jgi:hypothetical protein